MKFGKAFERQLPHGDAWRPHALAYQHLKHLVKLCAGLSRRHKLRAATFVRSRAAVDPRPRSDASLRTSYAEIAFFAALRDEIQKVNALFLRELRVSSERVQQLEHDIQDATRDVMLCCRAMESREGRSDAWLRRTGQLLYELRALEWFCVLNFCAVSKILKKHDKWTAYDTRRRFERAVLVRQPFATYVPLLQLVRRVETIALGVSVVALTEKACWTVPRTALTRGETSSALTEQQSRSDIKAPPLRIGICTDMDDANATDSEAITPRDGAETCPYSERERVVSDVEDQPPRQRQRRV